MDLTGVSIVELARQHGPFIGFIAFVLWSNWRREGKMGGRIETLEKSLQETLLPLVEKTSSVIARNTSVMQRLEKLMFPKKVRIKKASAARRKQVK
jgi:hypothetical protein